MSSETSEDSEEGCSKERAVKDALFLKKNHIKSTSAITKYINLCSRMKHSAPNYEETLKHLSNTKLGKCKSKTSRNRASCLAFTKHGHEVIHASADAMSK